MKEKTGKVYLVGAGPGDPELITLKALRLLKSADEVFYDYLVPTHWVDQIAPKKAYYVGKMGHGDAFGQDEIIKLLIESSYQNKITVRLKGGDPFIFGRGGEEAQALTKAQVPFEIVPGVSSAIAVPAYAGVPLTHRDFGPTVTFVAGHRDPTKEYPELQNLDWAALAKQNTLVFLMGVKNLAKNLLLLRQNGMSKETPAAMIEWGSLGGQRCLVATLETLPQLATEQGYQSPAIVLVGEIISLRKELQWFEKKPLFSKKILVTRAKHQIFEFSQSLFELGAEVIEFPCIEIVEPDSYEILDSALKDLSIWDYLIFTSANSVDFFLKRCQQKKTDIRYLTRAKVYAVGEKTAERLTNALIQVVDTPPIYNSAALGEFLQNEDLEGAQVLFPRAEKGNDTLKNFFIKKKSNLCLAPVYKTQMPHYSPEEMQRRFRRKVPDLLTFASSSSIKNFCLFFRHDDLWSKFSKIPCVVIGPETKKTALDYGFQVKTVAKEASIASMIEAILESLNAS